MSVMDITEALIDLRLLWGDVEWWSEQGLSRVRPTLKAAIDVIEELKQQNSVLREKLERKCQQEQQ